MKNLQGKKVRVYFNLHKKLYSVKDTKSNLVIAHVNKICLDNVKFIVSEKSRQRVLKDKRKNVHAYVEGIVRPCKSFKNEHRELLTYNPYKYNSFVIKATEKPIYNAENVLMICEDRKPSVFKTM